MRWRSSRALGASDDGAWARSHHEELAEKALTQSVPRGLSVARFTLAALGATTMEAAERRCREWPEAVSGSPQWDPIPSTVPVDTTLLAVGPGASSLKQLHAALRATWRVASNRH
jgi:hypothetical protein